MAFSVFIPDFQHSFEAAGRPRLPALERLVARAAVATSQTPAEFLAPLFGLEPTQIAPAPFMALADGVADDGGYRLCASFVHLAPDRDQLVLMPESLLEVATEEAAALVAAFNGLYGPEGWKLEVTKFGRTYLRCPEPLDAVTHEPAEAAGRAVLDFMPAGSDAVQLRQLMNETQMLFHTHAVNTAREEAGRPLINSLWLWGGGVLPKRGAGQAPRQIMSALPLVRGLALWAGQAPQTSGLPPFEQASLLASGAGDMATLEREWFAPLFVALKSGKLKKLNLYLGGLGSFGLDSAAARRFWRRSRPLGVS